jgi:Domain of unknown function (DUF4167)
MPRHQRSRKQRAFRPGAPLHPLNAQRNYERYLELAREKARDGDIIAAENYLQHAEHYLRSMNDQPSAGGSGRGR